MLVKIKNNTLLFSAGGILYALTELLWRKKTHWTMIITGGLCFLILFRLFDKIRKIGNLYKCIIGSFVITLVEFGVGCVVNIKFHMKVWYYSNMPFNLMGQICPIYSFLWGLLTIPIIFICNTTRKLTVSRGFTLVPLS